MTDTEALDLDAIDGRAAAATEGPWENDYNGISQAWTRPGPWQEIVTQEVKCSTYCYGGSCAGVVQSADAEFIAHARTDIPALVAEIRRLRALPAPVPVSGDELATIIHARFNEARGRNGVDPKMLARAILSQFTVTKKEETE